MMKITQYQVDAFASRAFEGNPAAVCPLNHWLDDALLQSIAEENNLSETAFFVPSGSGFALRWFTPAIEVDLCGHATLATAHVLFNVLGDARQTLVFTTRSGELRVEKAGRRLRMDFPASTPVTCEIPAALVDGLGRRPTALFAAEDYLAVFESEAIVRGITPNHAALSKLDLRGVIVTAPGDTADFVSRFFAPRAGVPEDPVTGSAHCELAPYWAARLGKTQLNARQISKRGGDIACELRGDRVLLTGSAVTVMRAEMSI